MVVNEIRIHASTNQKRTLATATVGAGIGSNSHSQKFSLTYPWLIKVYDVLSFVFILSTYQ